MSTTIVVVHDWSDSQNFPGISGFVSSYRYTKQYDGQLLHNKCSFYSSTAHLSDPYIYMHENLRYYIAWGTKYFVSSYIEPVAPVA